MNDTDTIHECLRQLRAGSLDHGEMLVVAAVVKQHGMPLSEFKRWFAQSKQVNDSVMATQWNSLEANHPAPVKIGSLVKLCRDHGGKVDTRKRKEDPGHELEWDAIIGGGRDSDSDTPGVDPEWVESHDMPREPEEWNPAEELRRYIAALFANEEHVGYTVDAFRTAEGRWQPLKGSFNRTAGQLLEALANCGADLGSVVGDWKPEAGAWIRFNPLDGQDAKDGNVTEHRYALVESDSLPIEKQYDIYVELELPIAAMVMSGGKSLHAIVRIDAPDKAEYRKRVDYLYSVCKKSGLDIDHQNRNPSRLSRMPGATRGGRRQWLVAVNTGKSNWTEWREWIEAVNDDLPDIISMADVWDNLPPLSPAIIEGLLREGHKMLLSGPSKAGKSYMLMQLCIAIAEGRKWLGWFCRQGRVLYVNLELDNVSALHRIKDLYTLTRIKPGNISNIEIWNLRGKAIPMDQLAPKLIRRAIKRGYTAIVIDPLYKIITGDENAADQMAKFCNQFDRVCHELKCAVIYCHHHSKGSQGQKQAHDRASGSGVFARDPDALIDLIELDIDASRRKVISNKWECAAIAAALDIQVQGWRDECPQDDALVADKLARWAEANGHGELVREVRPGAVAKAEHTSGWRVEGILREFAPFPPVRMFFTHPCHIMDTDGALEDAKAEGEEQTPNREAAIERRRKETVDGTLKAVELLMENGRTSVKALTEYLVMSDEAVRKRLRNAGLKIDNGFIFEQKKPHPTTT